MTHSECEECGGEHEDDGRHEGTQNDDWVNTAYQNQAGPNLYGKHAPPNADELIFKRRLSQQFHDRRAH